MPYTFFLKHELNCTNRKTLEDDLVDNPISADLSALLAAFGGEESALSGDPRPVRGRCSCTPKVRAYGGLPWAWRANHLG